MWKKAVVRKVGPLSFGVRRSSTLSNMKYFSPPGTLPTRVTHFTQHFSSLYISEIHKIMYICFFLILHLSFRLRVRSGRHMRSPNWFVKKMTCRFDVSLLLWCQNFIYCPFFYFESYIWLFGIEIFYCIFDHFFASNCHFFDMIFPCLINTILFYFLLCSLYNIHNKIKPYKYYWKLTSIRSGIWNL